MTSDGRQGWAAVVLAAGRGTRMRSQLPKALHTVAGRPWINHSWHVTLYVTAQGLTTGPMAIS